MLLCHPWRCTCCPGRSRCFRTSLVRRIMKWLIQLVKSDPCRCLFQVIFQGQCNGNHKNLCTFSRWTVYAEIIIWVKPFDVSPFVALSVAFRKKLVISDLDILKCNSAWAFGWLIALVVFMVPPIIFSLKLIVFFVIRVTADIGNVCFCRFWRKCQDEEFRQCGVREYHKESLGAPRWLFCNVPN